MYVIFNSDGSIKKQFLNAFIQQGDNNSKKIFVAIDGINPEDYELGAIATLPDDTNVTLPITDAEPLVVDGVSYPGKEISITGDATIFGGTIKINIVAVNNNVILVTYNLYLTVNETGIGASDPISITVSEYERLLAAIADIPSTYLPLSGGTLTGPLNLNNLIYSNYGEFRFNDHINFTDNTDQHNIVFQIFNNDVLCWKTLTAKSALNVDGLIFAGGQELRFGGDYLNIKDNTNDHNTILHVNKDYINAERVVTLKQGGNCDVAPTQPNHIVRKSYVDDNFVNKIGSLPFFTIGNDNILTFITNNNLSGKPFVFHSSIIGDKYLALFGPSSGNYDFEIESLSSLARYVGTNVDVSNKTFTSLLLDSTYREDYETSKNKVTSLSASSTNTEYPSAKAVYDEFQNVREVAEGKTKSWLLYAAETLDLSWSTYAYYDPNDGEFHLFESNEELTTWIGSSQVANSSFNSTNSHIGLIPNSNNYLILREKISNRGRLLVRLSDAFYSGGAVSAEKLFKRGDSFYLIDSNIPDRWFTGEYSPTIGGMSFVALDAKSDLSGYYDKSNSLIPTTTNAYDLGSSSYTFKDLYLGGKIASGNSEFTIDNTYHNLAYYYNGTLTMDIANTGDMSIAGGFRSRSDNAKDLGTSSFRWKDLYLSGNLSDGTNSVSVAGISKTKFYKHHLVDANTGYEIDVISQRALPYLFAFGTTFDNVNNLFKSDNAIKIVDDGDNPMLYDANAQCFYELILSGGVLNPSTMSDWNLLNTTDTVTEI